MKLVDTHAHLMDAQFDADRPAVFERAAAAGVQGLICVGYDLRTSRAALELAENWPGVWAAVGVHPNSVAAAPGDWLGVVRELAAHPRVVAIGETGLDYYRKHTAPEAQRAAFSAQLVLAAELRLPVIVHCRDAETDTLKIVQGVPLDRGGVFHCFSGSEATMRAAVAAGYYVSYAGALTFKNAAALRQTAAATPSDRLLVETDCPYLSPMPYRGERNEPARVSLTATALADARALDPEQLGQLTTANAERLFGVAFGAVA